MANISVFISYSRKDHEIARDVALMLMELGIDVFLDTIHIQPGQHWDKTIHLALYRSTHLLLIHSENSFDSENVWDEWTYFRDKSKPIIPLVFDKTELPYRLSRVQYIDCMKFNEDQVIRRLLSIIRPVAVPEMPLSAIFIRNEEETQEADNANASV